MLMPMPCAMICYDAMSFAMPLLCTQRRYAATAPDADAARYALPPFAI